MTSTISPSALSVLRDRRDHRDRPVRREETEKTEDPEDPEHPEDPEKTVNRGRMGEMELFLPLSARLEKSSSASWIHRRGWFARLFSRSAAKTREAHALPHANLTRRIFVFWPARASMAIVSGNDSCADCVIQTWITRFTPRFGGVFYAQHLAQLHGRTNSVRLQCGCLRSLNRLASSGSFASKAAAGRSCQRGRETRLADAGGHTSDRSGTTCLGHCVSGTLRFSAVCCNRL